MKKAILLINVGTPDSPELHDVRRFLSVFLNDPHVITLPGFWRKLLVNLVIVPFRAPKSAALYRQLWTENGSPLRYYLEQVRDLLQKKTGNGTDVWAAMNYGKPNIADVMNEMRSEGYQQLTVIPLFPQYALSTTGSVEDKVKKYMAQWPDKPELNIVRQFYHHPVFLEAWNKRITDYEPEKYDHLVFSFHGLPLSHLPVACRKRETCTCMQQANNTGLTDMPSYCYKATCYDMAAKMAARLGLANENYSVAFQSRMSNSWLQPFTDHTLNELAAKGMKVLVVAPSFVADCLETSTELGIEYKKMFLDNGGKKYTLVESLNDQPEWIEALFSIHFHSQLIEHKTPGIGSFVDGF